MTAYWTMLIRAVIFLLIGCGTMNSWGQGSTSGPSVLHIQRSVTTSLTGFPQYLYTYQVLGGANSTGAAQALTGTISIENSTPNFSEVLWLLAYWQGECPKEDPSLAGANFMWSDILKNPAQSTSQFPVNLRFPDPIPMSGCVGLIFAGGPLVQGEVTMSADLNLTYEPASPVANTVLDASGEYCFGQNWGCENWAASDEQGFGVPITMPISGHLAELYGNISDSTFDGTPNFGPLPTGDAWGSVNDFYLLRGGCGKFAQVRTCQGFPDPRPLSTLYSWLPDDAVHLDSVPMEYKIPPGQTGRATLQQRVERIFPDPVPVNAGDCIVVIYGRTGNGATDNETQVHVLLAP